MADKTTRLWILMVWQVKSDPVLIKLLQNIKTSNSLAITKYYDKSHIDSTFLICITTVNPFKAYCKIASQYFTSKLFQSPFAC